MTTIYALIDPRTDEVRYVGKTVLRPEDRLHQHLMSVVRSGAYGRNAKDVWLADVLRAGTVPRQELLEQFDSGNPDLDDEREQFWIAEMRANGEPLTNHNRGGGGARSTTTKATLAELPALFAEAERRPEMRRLGSQTHVNAFLRQLRSSAT